MSVLIPSQLVSDRQIRQRSAGHRVREEDGERGWGGAAYCVFLDGRTRALERKRELQWGKAELLLY